MVYLSPCGTCSAGYRGALRRKMACVRTCTRHAAGSVVCCTQHVARCVLLYAAASRALHTLELHDSDTTYVFPSANARCAALLQSCARCCMLHSASCISRVACGMARTWLSTTPPSNERDAKIQQSFAAHTYRTARLRGSPAPRFACGPPTVSISPWRHAEPRAAQGEGGATHHFVHRVLVFLEPVVRRLSVPSTLRPLSTLSTPALQGHCAFERCRRCRSSARPTPLHALRQQHA